MFQKLRIFVVFFALSAFMCVGFPAHANDADPFRSTDYPLPRYVSLGANKIYVRTGPGHHFPIKWTYKKRGLPVEIVLEYDVWRKIIDFDGESGWIHKTLLSGKRMAIVLNNGLTNMHKKPSNNSAIKASLEPKVLVEIEECNGTWCHVKASGYKGWVGQNVLWGVYEDEEFD